MMIKEIWKDIKEYEGFYQVSNLGRIKSLKTNKIRKFNKNRYGYYLVTLYNNGIMKNIAVHRIVAETFIPNNKNLPQVNHIDGNKINNNVNNLEWCTAKYNIKYSYEKLGRKGYSNNSMYKGEKHWSNKKVRQYDINGNFIKEWYSQKEARMKLEISDGSISDCCNNKRKTAGGYIWKFV